ncbi:MAG: class I SAM-dependent methyltransferase [Cryomorphaceae bacterium]
MKSLYRSALNTLPRPLLIRLSYVFRIFASFMYRGNSVECPVCGHKFSKFLSYGSEVAFRQNVLCPHCLSLERHRLLWLYLQQRTNLFSEKVKLLHIAPEQCFHGRFKATKNIEYVTGDLESPLAEHHFDLHDVPFEADSFDAVICNHVLEHVEDDRRCMRELYRVLRPGGWAIMQVPVDYDRAETYEDETIITPEDREKHFWQKDHVRLFGRDYPDRLADAGFKVKSDDFVKSLGEETTERFRLQRREVVYFLTK